MIEFPCPHCGRHLNIPEKFAGQRGRCNHCEHVFNVPKLRDDLQLTDDTHRPLARPARAVPVTVEPGIQLQPVRRIERPQPQPPPPQPAAPPTVNVNINDRPQRRGLRDGFNFGCGMLLAGFFTFVVLPVGCIALFAPFGDTSDSSTASTGAPTTFTPQSTAPTPTPPPVTAEPVQRVPLYVDILRAARSAGGAHTDMDVELYNTSTATIGYWSLTLLFYDANGNYLGNALVMATNIAPGQSKVETTSLLDMPPDRIATWKPQLDTLRDGEFNALDHLVTLEIGRPQ